MENKEKYYTPQIEELKEGFRYLSEIYNEEKDEYTGKYEVKFFSARSGIGHDDYCTFTEGRVKVKLLDKEDIASCGFKLEVTDLGQDTENNLLAIKPIGETYAYGDFDLDAVEGKENVQLFDTWYNIKNISEFKVLLKMLGICTS